MRQTHRLAALALVAVLPVAALGEPVTETCQSLASAEVCACATEKLAEALSAADMALYATASGHALALQATGTPLADAWDTATGKAAAVAGVSHTAARATLNTAGNAHRDAIEACGG